MGAELVELAASGATALVTAAATDMWAQIRDRAGRLLTRNHADRVDQARLELAQAELEAAGESGDETVVTRIRADWEARLRDQLAHDPAAVAELRELLALLSPSGAAQQVVTVVNNQSTGDIHGTVFQIGGNLGSVNNGPR
ncbi:hypothetical protein ACFYNO_00840 [Kitasatospora sp. NPDC006697]|uniref:hypothetical protein n=1 Tax=Kitasatospora sp. NPDC006697 TaxID=3364020 RepID=UPI0036C65FB9